MATAPARSPALRILDRMGRSTVGGVEQFGRGAGLIVESFYWLIVDPSRPQPVRPRAVFVQMRSVSRPSPSSA